MARVLNLNILGLLFLVLVVWDPWILLSNADAPLTFKNPLGPRSLGLGQYGGQTPWVYQHNDGFYYYVVTSAPTPSSITVMRSRRLSSWDSAAKNRKIVFNATAPYTHIYEPQVQQFGGNWYVYFEMGIDRDLNSSRNFVIQSEGGANPMEAEFGPPTQMKAVGEVETATGFHGTILQYSPDELFYIWASDTKRASDTPSTFTNKTETISLFIAPMSSPVQISGPAVLLRAPSKSWEKSILEAPHVLHSPSSPSVFLTYFAGDFTEPDSCLGMIALRHGFNPLVQENWSDGECVFWQNEKQHVYSVGKAGFTKSPDRSESWILYTATDDQKTQSVRAEKFAWDKNGDPVFPRPAGLDIAIKLPSEAPKPPPGSLYSLSKTEDPQAETTNGN